MRVVASKLACYQGHKEVGQGEQPGLRRDRPLICHNIIITSQKSESMLRVSSLHGKVLSYCLFFHLGSLHADHSEKGLTGAPFHKDVVQFDGGFFFFGFVFDGVGVECP